MTGWRGAELSWGESQEAAQGFLRGTDSADGMAWLHDFRPFSTSHILLHLFVLVSLRRPPHVPFGS
ncbi:hypothetical protein ACSS6W_007201 [Trichoderma asperelloides]